MSILNTILSGTNGLGDAAIKRGVPVAAIAMLLKNRPELAPLVEALLVGTLMGLNSQQEQQASRQAVAESQLDMLQSNQQTIFQLIEQLAEVSANPGSTQGEEFSKIKQTAKMRRETPAIMTTPAPCRCAEKRRSPFQILMLRSTAWLNELSAGMEANPQKKRRLLRLAARQRRDAEANTI